MNFDPVVAAAWRQAADHLTAHHRADGLALVVVDAIHAEHPACQVALVLTCPDHGAVEPCDRPAVERVTLRCSEPGCDCAVWVALLCTAHADAIDSVYQATRRPL